MKLETPISAMRHHAVTLLWAVLLVPLASCLELESRTCSEDLTCPSGMRCSGDGSACISTPCGNLIVEFDEQCDDGNLRDGDGCSKDCRSTEICGNDTEDPGEACDDGNNEDGDGCSANCKSKEICGNGIVDAAVGEVCDRGDTVDGDGCSANCRSDERCGNNVIDTAVGEVCDKGDTEDGNECSADCRSGEGCGNGIRDSTEDCDENGETARCNFNCTFSVCGDGIKNATAGEECDDGSANGQGNCLANCKLKSTCGDRVDQSWEVCDDGNRDPCGTCGYTCQEYRLTDATGSIIAVRKDDLNDGETFTLSNGISSRRTFEFDKGNDPGSVEFPRVRVPIRDAVDASDVARVMVSAINATAGLFIRADQGPNPVMVILTNITTDPRAGASGNQRITETVANPGFKANGMAGGGASDCPAGVACRYGTDCASDNCTNGVCVQ